MKNRTFRGHRGFPFRYSVMLDGRPGAAPAPQAQVTSNRSRWHARVRSRETRGLTPRRAGGFRASSEDARHPGQGPRAAPRGAVSGSLAPRRDGLRFLFITRNANRSNATFQRPAKARAQGSLRSREDAQSEVSPPPRSGSSLCCPSPRPPCSRQPRPLRGLPFPASRPGLVHA